MVECITLSKNIEHTLLFTAMSGKKWTPAF